MFLFIGVCQPLKAYWDVDIQNAKCLSDQQVMNIVLAQGSMQANVVVPMEVLLTMLKGLSTITDLICAAFPTLFLRNLQVKLRTKIALCLLMGLGVM